MIGFTKIFVDDDGFPSEKDTEWVADAFVVFAWVVYIGKVRHISEVEAP